MRGVAFGSQTTYRTRTGRLALHYAERSRCHVLRIQWLVRQDPRAGTAEGTREHRCAEQAARSGAGIGGETDRNGHAENDRRILAPKKAGVKRVNVASAGQGTPAPNSFPAGPARPTPELPPE